MDKSQSKSNSSTQGDYPNCVKCNAPKVGGDRFFHWCYSCFVKAEALNKPETMDKYKEYCKDKWAPQEYMFRSDSDEEKTNKGK